MHAMIKHFMRYLSAAAYYLASRMLHVKAAAAGDMYTAVKAVEVKTTV